MNPAAVDVNTAREVAAILRRVLVELPPETPRDRRVARRIEGAALALDVVAGGPRIELVSAP